MRALSTILLAVLVVGAVGGTANADRTALERRSDRRRAVHAIAIGGFGLVYVTSEFLVKDTLAPEECAWCNPPGVDDGVRDALRWDHPERANIASAFTGYIVPPFATMGLLVASSWSDGDKRQWFDDVAPVLEASLIVGLINQTAKFVVGRSRPLVRFGEPERPPTTDDHTSFFSGHTALVFAETFAAGVVARRRGYALEPVIWASGLTLGVATAYLRVAADKHYLTDVVAGAVIGSAIGLITPLVFHADVLGEDVVVTPTSNGLALSGTF
jgi:membrane-associated phospholipid phosphatase